MKKWNNIRQESRNLKIVKMRDKDKLSFIKIGKVFNITYQRAWKIYNSTKNSIKNYGHTNNKK
jgi:hypothetical protein